MVEPEALPRGSRLIGSIKSFRKSGKTTGYQPVHGSSIIAVGRVHSQHPHKVELKVGTFVLHRLRLLVFPTY